QVIPTIDGGVAAHGDMQRLGMHREHRAQLREPLTLPGAGSIVGMVLPVRLRDAKIELARHDLAEIVVGAARRRRGAPDTALPSLIAAFRSLLVHEAADRVTGGEIDAGGAARTDRDEPALLGIGGRG